MNEFRNLDDRIDAVFTDREHSGGVSESEIQAAEERLGLNFPPSFRRFLARFGAAWLNAPYTIDGLPNTPPDESPLHGDVVQTNLQLRSGVSLFPRNLLNITSDGSDLMICLDSAQARDDGEWPVIVVGPGTDHIRIADSFIDFAEIASRTDPLNGIC